MQLMATSCNINALHQRRLCRTHHGASRPVSPAVLHAIVPATALQLDLSKQIAVARRSTAPRYTVAARASNDSAVLDTVVVGAGISGLVTAQALQTQHGDHVKTFLVTEGRERVGGNITSMQGDGYVWEEGPNSFQPNDAMLQAAVSIHADKRPC